MRGRPWLILSQGLLQRWNKQVEIKVLKGLDMCGANPFRVGRISNHRSPRVVAKLQPCAEISERLRRYNVAAARAATAGTYSTGMSPLSARRYCQSFGFSDAISSLRVFTFSGLPR